MFPFWAPGSDGWAAAKNLGSRWPPFMFPSFWVLGRMGGPRQRSWASIGFPSYFLSGLLGRIGSLHVSFFLGSWVGWVGRGQEAGLALGSLHIAFLDSWVGWVGRGQEAGLLLGSLHVSWWAAAKKLGSRWAPFILFGFWADGWAAAGTCFLSGSWVGWVGRSKEAGLPLGSLHISFLDSWVGWVVRGQKSWVSHWAPFLSGILGRMRCNEAHFPAQDGSLLVTTLDALTGRLDQPRPRDRAPARVVAPPA